MGTEVLSFAGGMMNALVWMGRRIVRTFHTDRPEGNTILIAPKRLGGMWSQDVFWVTAHSADWGAKDSVTIASMQDIPKVYMMLKKHNMLHFYKSVVAIIPQRRNTKSRLMEPFIVAIVGELIQL